MELFSGEGNTLTIFRKYGTVFLCDLDLSLYPFDTQECFMHLKITTAPKNFLVFDSLLSNVTYSASKMLLEYEVSEDGGGGEGQTISCCGIPGRNMEFERRWSNKGCEVRL